MSRIEIIVALAKFLRFVKREVLPLVFIVGLVVLGWKVTVDDEFDIHWAGLLVFYVALWFIIGWVLEMVGLEDES